MFLHSRFRSTTLTCILVSVLLVIPSTVVGLEASEQTVRGQVVKVLPAEIDGHPHGMVLSVDRNIDREPYAELRVVPGPDPNDWITIRLHEGPTAMAVGDVNGDGDDDVAIAHQLAGETCPFPNIGNGPCGVVRIYDGNALVRGELQVIAQVSTLAIADACPPSSFNPAAIALGDVTGNGRAELAIGQLGVIERTCGTVYVIPGSRLSGDATVHDACIRLKGSPSTQGSAPDHFGSHMQLFGDRHLAIGAPYGNGTDDAPVAGLLAIHDVRSACQRPGSTPTTTQPVAELMGEEKGQLFGKDTAYAEHTLWVTFNGGIRGFAAPSFAPTHTYDIPRSFPLSVAGDLNKDGRMELQAGPWIIQPGDPEEELILQMVRFAEDTFRGAVLGPDHILSADKFGSRLWSLTDLWDPFLHIAPEHKRMSVGDTMRVFVAEAVFLIPDPGDVQWSATGATILERNETWVKIRADGPGVATVQATLADTVQTVQIPIDVPKDKVAVTGPEVVLVDRPLITRVHAPEGTSISWEAPGGTVTNGSGTPIETTYAKPGHYTITIHATLPSGEQGTVTYNVDVLQKPLRIVGPDRIDQGQVLDLTVQGPREDRQYHWILDGDRIGVSTLMGPSVQAPMGVWGPVNVTAVERDSDGTATAVGHLRVHVENLPPVIQSMEVLADPVTRFGLGGQTAVADPGGDPVSMVWTIGDTVVSRSESFTVKLSKPGMVEVTLVVTDEAGLSTTATRTVDVKDILNTEVQTAEVQGDSSGPQARQTPVPGTAAAVVFLLTLAAFVRRNGQRPGESHG